MLCVLGGALVCTPKRKYWLYVNGDDICCAYGFRLVCSARQNVWRGDSGENVWWMVSLRVSASVFCKAKMSGVAFCAEEVIVDVLKLSVVFSRRYFSC